MGLGEGNGNTKEGGGRNENISPPYFWIILKNIIFKTKNGGFNWKKSWLAKQQYHDIVFYM